MVIKQYQGILQYFNKKRFVYIIKNYLSHYTLDVDMKFPPGLDNFMYKEEIHNIFYKMNKNQTSQN